MKLLRHPKNIIGNAKKIDNRKPALMMKKNTGATRLYYREFRKFAETPEPT